MFDAFNSAKQCVDLGKIYDGSCAVGLLATNGGYITFKPYDCDRTCKTRVDGQAGMINGTMYSGGVCDNGCKVAPNLDPGTDFSLRENGNPNAISIRSGTWRATGDVCIPDNTPPKPENKDEYCHQAAGYQVCKSKDKTCISSASGFRTCASDTSNKTGHTATNNPRTEAASISAPNTPANPPTNRPGENWQSQGQGGGITNNSSTDKSTNNYNFYGNKGTPNGNNPTPGDGSGPGAGGSNGNGEKGEGNGNTASGGGTCTSPPATGGDPILGMIAMQTWSTRCAAEKANGGKVTGDVGNCDAPFSVEGDTVQANQLRAQRAQLCAGRPGEGQGSGGNPHAGAEDVDGPGKWSWKFDADLIDTSGFGGGSCPTFGTLDFGKFGSVSLDNTTWWCQLVSAIHTVMLLMGMFISFRIVFGDA
ncbi:hypothetical protein GT799_02725 [Stenotrophomonas maltophilia]|uniref:hypothetical protein n=1 Tax=Stenotrophomonas maltophilia TaxID=40324 RepID=UPI001F216B33|nr:hypothetical protein [Stenotrophomonas maltophilia]MCF3458650.1 hypothetical protein [Stenotrophomonas maltophilia]MCF3515140.1 hypothetical protein [Stenotrophomonas maltophilia]